MTLKCIICEKKIDDHGLLFCSKCRKKDWKIRFIALQRKEKKRDGWTYNKGGRGMINSKPTIVFGTYWEKRRYERENK